MQTCNICSENTSKYKCPACRIRYCSLICYKEHKETCLPVQTPGSTHPESKNTGSAEPGGFENILDDDAIIDKVPLHRLQLLGQSKKLRDLLYNPHLRELLRSIDCAENKAEAMKAAMQEPLFVEFSDRCLKIVENNTTESAIDDEDFNF